MVQIVFSDIDGTLLDTRHQLSPATRRAIAALEGKSVPFVIVTARGPMAVAPLLEEQAIRCPVISYSGALMRDTAGNTLFHQGLSAELAGQILAYIESLPFAVTSNIYSFDQWLVKDRRDPLVRQEEDIVHTQASQGWLPDVRGDEIHKLLCMGTPQEIAQLEQRLRRAFPGCTVARSADTMLEVMAGGVNKGRGVERACQLWGFSPRDAAAFGDHYNDMDMLRAVGHGFLMGNAPRELLESYPRRTLDNDSDGVAHALRALGLLEG